MADRTNPSSEIILDMAAELADARERGVKSRVVAFGKQSYDMTTIRTKLENGTPTQREAILKDLKQNKDYKAKRTQLLSHYKGRSA